METTLTIIVTTDRDDPELVDKILGRIYTLDAVSDVKLAKDKKPAKRERYKTPRLAEKLEMNHMALSSKDALAAAEELRFCFESNQELVDALKQIRNLRQPGEESTDYSIAVEGICEKTIDKLENSLW